MKYAQNFHELMILVGDAHALTHPQRMRLRQKIERVYRSQPRMTAENGEPWVSLEALTIACKRLLDSGKSLNAVVNMKASDLIAKARGVEG